MLKRCWPSLLSFISSFSRFISVSQVRVVDTRRPPDPREKGDLWWCQLPSLPSWWLERLGCRWRCWAWWRRRPHAAAPDPKRACLSRRPPLGQMASPSCRCRMGGRRCQLFGGQKRRCRHRIGPEVRAGLRDHGTGQRPSGRKSLWRIWHTPWTPTRQYLTGKRKIKDWLYYQFWSLLLNQQYDIHTNYSQSFSTLLRYTWHHKYAEHRHR